MVFDVLCWPVTPEEIEEALVSTCRGKEGGRGEGGRGGEEGKKGRGEKRGRGRK